MAQFENPINEIKKAEKDAEQLVKRAQEEVSSLIFNTKLEGEKELKKVQEDVAQIIKAINKTAEAKIKEILQQQAKKTEIRIKKLDSLATKRIEEAAKFVMSELGYKKEKTVKL